jgi:hypothetical protein
MNEIIISLVGLLKILSRMCSRISRKIYLHVLSDELKISMMLETPGVYNSDTKEYWKLIQFFGHI